MKIYYKIILCLTLFLITTMMFTDSKASENTAGVNNGIIVYYFHGNQRCVTCRNIEELSKTATEKIFSNQLKGNSIKFISINVDDAKNEHFIQDYQLIVRSVVIAKINNGNETGWRRLDKVWTLHNDPDKFFKYFESEASQLLKRK